jgi:hypothetical protein
MVMSSYSVQQLYSKLQEVTERLASELVRPSHVRPAWDDLHWQVALAVATIQGLSAQLSRSLLWKGPDLWERFLRDQSDHTVRRYQHIGHLLAELGALARRSAVAIVALKGAALRDYGLYAGGERPTGDIDLLVRPDDLETAVSMLTRFGYVRSQTMSRHLVFAPAQSINAVGFGEHIDNPIKIELHTRIAEKLPITEVDITRQVFPARPGSGLNPYRSTAALMLHLLLHAAGSIRARALRMIQLHDMALLSRCMTQRDWSELLTGEPGRRPRWWAYPPMLLTARHYPGAIPAEVMDTLERDCPWLLKTVAQHHRLTDVSWSDIRIHALPGIEWSGTPWEALRFMKSRIVPDRADLAVLAYVAANDPASQRTPWYGLSHGARIVRWLMSRPPRVQTMHAVQSAMEYAGPTGHNS